MVRWVLCLISTGKTYSENLLKARVFQWEKPEVLPELVFSRDSGNLILCIDWWMIEEKYFTNQGSSHDC